MDLDRMRRRFDQGRADTVRELRELADYLERLPRREAAECLTALQPSLDGLRAGYQKSRAAGGRFVACDPA